MNLKEASEKYAAKVEVLSGWQPGETFEVKMRKPGIYAMANAGMIPNPLMADVQKMFTGSPKQTDAVPAEKQAKILTAMARYAMLEPTYDEVQAAGLELTDQQLMEIYSFALGGAAALATFRKVSRRAAEHAVERVQGETERAAED